MAGLRANSDVLGLLATIEAKYDEAAWLGLLRSMVAEAPKATVTGRPSAAKAKAMSEAEEGRIKAQVAELGAEALAGLGAKLEAAVAENEAPPPDELLSSLPIPDASKLESVAITTAIDAGNGAALVMAGSAAEALQAHLQASRVELPVATVQLTHVASVFVVVGAALDSSALPTGLRL